MEKYMLPCFLKQIFGFDCPGCGAQRSFVLLLKGDFGAAFHMFPAVYTMVLFGLTVVLHFLDKSRDYLKPMRYLGILNAFVILAAYIIKMFVNH